MKMFELVIWFQNAFPELVSLMKNADHHNTGVNLNPYHLEGDVWTHVMMVCKQAENMPYEVKLAALLHDIGKPFTRNINPKTGFTSFYNHDSISAFAALEVLNKLEESDKVIRDVFTLVALHTQVFKQTKEQIADMFQGDQRLCDMFMQLGLADGQGRFHSDESRTVTEPVQVNERSIRIPTSKRLTILCGLPCSGKSTFTKHAEGAFVVSRDSLVKSKNPELTYNEAFKKVNQNTIDRELELLFKEALNHDNVIVDMTNMSKKRRVGILSKFDNSWTKDCILFLADAPTLHERNNYRKDKENKFISSDVFDKMATNFYMPCYNEGFDNIILEVSRDSYS